MTGLVPEVLVATPLGRTCPGCGRPLVRVYPACNGKIELHLDEAKNHGYFVFKRTEDHQPGNRYTGVDFGSNEYTVSYTYVGQVFTVEEVQRAQGAAPTFAELIDAWKKRYPIDGETHRNTVSSQDRTQFNRPRRFPPKDRGSR